MRTKEVAAAEELLASIAAGEVRWTMASHGWMVIGRADIVREGAEIEVTKADGSRMWVQVTRCQPALTKRGVTYACASANASPAASAAQESFAGDLGIEVAGLTARQASARIQRAQAEQDSRALVARVEARTLSRYGINGQIWDEE